PPAQQPERERERECECGECAEVRERLRERVLDKGEQLPELTAGVAQQPYQWRVGVARPLAHSLTAARAGGAEVVGPVERLAPYEGAAVRRVDHLARADDDADVRDMVGVAAEEDEVARQYGFAGLQARTRVVLLLGDARQRDPGGLIGGLDEAGAVEAARPLAAPEVGGADLGERKLDRPRRRRGRRSGCTGADL